jgi:hypothetical protein
MHIISEADIERRVKAKSALSGISYATSSINRWAIKAETLMTGRDEAEARDYLALIEEDVARLNAELDRLNAAMNPASVQVDTRETKEIAA